MLKTPVANPHQDQVDPKTNGKRQVGFAVVQGMIHCIEPTQEQAGN